MERIKDKSPWACFMTYLGTNQLEVASQVFPWAAVGAADLTNSPRWVEWYGRDLDVRVATKLLKAKEYEESTDTGVTVDLSDANADSGPPAKK